MILAIDVHYKETYAKNVGVLFNWQDAAPSQTIINQLDSVEEYIPGQFFKRELPCLLAVIQEVDLNSLEAIIVDGHVYIDNDKGHGLGGFFWNAIGSKVPVIGVAKRSFHTNKLTNKEVLRGDSKNPLFVSAIGMDLEDAVERIANMHGEYRMPTILQILDTETKKS